MRNLALIALIGAAVAPAAGAAAYDAFAPVPPLPDPKAHGDAWNATWSTIIAARPLGTARRRAVTLAQLADEQCAQVSNGISHAQESTWLEAWINAYKAGNAADADTFGPLEGAGTKYGGEGPATLVGNDAIDTILDGDEPDVWGLSPLGAALKLLAAQWRRVVADATANSVPWIQGGNPNESTINGTKAAIRAFARAMDAAVEPAGFFGKLVHLPVGIAEDAANAALNALLDALSMIVGDVAPYALAGGVLYLAVRK